MSICILAESMCRSRPDPLAWEPPRPTWGQPPGARRLVAYGAMPWDIFFATLRHSSAGAQVTSICFSDLEMRHRASRQCTGINLHSLKLLSTLKADFVRSLLDGEDATELAVPAPEDELEDPQQRVHASCARRRSRLPFASSHPIRVRTLARARAIEQSAAP